MIKKFLALICLVMLPAYLLAAGADFRLPKGMSFQKADSELRNDGWHPRAMHTKIAYEFVGIENELRDHGVHGIEACAGDRQLCVIHYAKKNKCLRLITRGEFFEELKIETWSRECPSNDVL